MHNVKEMNKSLIVHVSPVNDGQWHKNEYRGHNGMQIR